MPYAFYKILHLASLFAIFMSLGAVAHHLLRGGTKATSAKKLLGMTHGIGLLLVLISGFGLLARLQIGFPGWIYGKLLIWLLIGGSTALMFKKPQMAKLAWPVLILLGLIAAYLAQAKPF